MKNILKIVCVLSLGVLLFAGCDVKKLTNTNNKPLVFEYLSKIEATNTIEEISNIIGVEAKVKEESKPDASSKWTLYSWEITEDTSIEGKFYEDSKNLFLEAVYPKDLVKNDKVDLTNASELKSKINQSGGLMYDEVKSLLGGVDGVLVKKDSYSNTYIWANANGGNITAHFNKDGKCTSFTGMVN